MTRFAATGYRRQNHGLSPEPRPFAGAGRVSREQKPGAISISGPDSSMKTLDLRNL